LLRFLLLLQVTAGTGRQRRGGGSRSTDFYHLHQWQRMNPRAASGGGALGNAPPLFQWF